MSFSFAGRESIGLSAVLVGTRVRAVFDPGSFASIAGVAIPEVVGLAAALPAACEARLRRHRGRLDGVGRRVVRVLHVRTAVSSSVYCAVAVAQRPREPHGFLGVERADGRRVAYSSAEALVDSRWGQLKQPLRALALRPGQLPVHVLPPVLLVV